MLDDRCQRLVAALARVIGVGEDHRSGTVVDAGRVAGGHRAVSLERTQLCHRLQARVAANRFVASTTACGWSPVTNGAYEA